MQPNQFFHIYNRGNNRQKIFFSRENYLYFLEKLRIHILPHMHLIAWCLMPNHFHWLCYSKSNIAGEKFSNDLRVMLRSYARAINKQEDRIGSLFQQHSKIKPLEFPGGNVSSDTMTRSHSITGNRKISTPQSRATTLDLDNINQYPFTCFHYIHQNPLKAGLVKKMEDWEMSSFRDYAGIRNGKLCNKSIASKYLYIPDNPKEFIKQSYDVKIV
ncbi:MAG: hypothetical protein WD048_15600 [Chitinophagales bacterium]